MGGWVWVHSPMSENRAIVKMYKRRMSTIGLRLFTMCTRTLEDSQYMYIHTGCMYVNEHTSKPYQLVLSHTISNIRNMNTHISVLLYSRQCHWEHIYICTMTPMKHGHKDVVTCIVLPLYFLLQHVIPQDT